MHAGCPVEVALRHDLNGQVVQRESRAGPVVQFPIQSQGSLVAGGGLDAAGKGKVTLQAGDVLEVVAANAVASGTYGADLSGTDLRTAEDLTNEQLEQTIGDEETIVPDYLTRPRRWVSELGAR